MLKNFNNFTNFFHSLILDSILSQIYGEEKIREAEIFSQDKYFLRSYPNFLATLLSFANFLALHPSFRIPCQHLIETGSSTFLPLLYCSQTAFT